MRSSNLVSKILVSLAVVVMSSGLAVAQDSGADNTNGSSNARQQSTGGDQTGGAGMNGPSDTTPQSESGAQTGNSGVNAGAGANGSSNTSQSESGAQSGGAHANAGATLNIGTPIQLAYSAAGVLHSQMQQSDDVRIPQSLINGARCIAVFPSVLKAGFIFAAKNGDGVAGCRGKSGKWSEGAPAFFALSGGSFGLQGGAKTTEVLVFFMNKQAVKQLTSDNFKVGAKASATAGPVGARASVHTAPAPIVTYRLQSSGGFAGVELKGATISANDTVNKNMYGQNAQERQLLLQHSQVPDSLKVFTNTLEQYAPSSKYNSQMKVKNNSSS